MIQIKLFNLIKSQKKLIKIQKKNQNNLKLNTIKFQKNQEVKKICLKNFRKNKNKCLNLPIRKDL